MDTPSVLLFIGFLCLILLFRAFLLRVQVELFNWLYKDTEWAIPVPGFGLAIGTELTEILACLFGRVILELLALEFFYPQKPAMAFMVSMGLLIAVNVMTFVRAFMLEIDSWQALALTLIDLVLGVLVVGSIALVIFFLIRLQIV